MRSDSSAARAGQSAARRTRPLRSGLAAGPKNVNRSGRLAVAGIRVTSEGKYARGATALPAADAEPLARLGGAARAAPAVAACAAVMPSAAAPTPSRNVRRDG